MEARRAAIGMRKAFADPSRLGRGSHWCSSDATLACPWTRRLAGREQRAAATDHGPVQRLRGRSYCQSRSIFIPDLQSIRCRSSRASTSRQPERKGALGRRRALRGGGGEVTIRGGLDDSGVDPVADSRGRTPAMETAGSRVATYRSSSNRGCHLLQLPQQDQGIDGHRLRRLKRADTLRSVSRPS